MFGLVVLTIFSGTELTLAKYIQLAQDEDFETAKQVQTAESPPCYDDAS